MYIFIDESGDHNLRPEGLDNLYNVFVLGAFCIEESDYSDFETRFNAMKTSLFWGDDFIIHTAEITRPNRSLDERNKLFHDADLRKRFYHSIHALIEETPFHFISCVIKKNDFVGRYGVLNSQDPYLFSIENLLNRILWLDNWPHKLYPEKRWRPLDQILELEILKYKTMGTRFHSGAKIVDSIDEFVLKDKNANWAGQQFVDLLVSPIGRHVLWKPPKPTWNEVSFQMIKKRMSDKNFTVFP